MLLVPRQLRCALCWVLVSGFGLSVWEAGCLFPDHMALAQISSTTPGTLRAAATAPQAQQLPNQSAGGGLRGMPGTMFNMPRPAAAGNTSANSAEAGLLKGSERFLRRNRKPGTFVGSDSQDAAGFVGASQATAKPTTAPDDGAGELPLAKPNTLNAASQELLNRSLRSYPPRLSIGFDVPRVSGVTINGALAQQLREIPGLHPSNQIEVSVAGDVATLRGVVASARDRSLAEQLILFEPGISSVKNVLQVRPPPPAPELPLRRESPSEDSPVPEPPPDSAREQ